MGRRIGLATVVYGLLASIAITWCLLLDRNPIELAADGRLLQYHLALRVLLSVLLGAVVAAVVVWMTRGLVRRTRWAERLHIAFRELLGPVTGNQIAFFAVSSGIAEELFFRGALQPAVGIIVASLVFGLVHIGPNRAFLPWTLWAIAMGFVFGGVYWLTGSLVGPILAHAAINYENLHFIQAYDPAPPGRERRLTPSAPGLVGDRLRSGGRTN